MSVVSLRIAAGGAGPDDESKMEEAGESSRTEQIEDNPKLASRRPVPVITMAEQRNKHFPGLGSAPQKADGKPEPSTSPASSGTTSRGIKPGER